MNGRRKQTIKVQAVTQPTTENGVSSLSNSPLDSQTKINIESPIIDIDQRSIFIQTLQAVECSPREAAETIADLFFSGNINDPKWLRRVLTQDATGFIPPRGQRLMFSFWCITRGLPFDEEDLPSVEFNICFRNSCSDSKLILGVTGERELSPKARLERFELQLNSNSKVTNTRFRTIMGLLRGRGG